MVQLVLSIGLSSCTLSSDELQKYPDSLLASISTNAGNSGSSSCSAPPASCSNTAFSKAHLDCAGDTSSPQLLPSNNTITIRLDELPNNPFTDWPEALKLIPSMFRAGYISADLLEPQLKEWQRVGAGNDKNPSKSNTTTMPTTSRGQGFYHKLADLLAFLNLPGPVSNWLPCHAMELYHANCLAFFYESIAFEAVHNMMSYKPNVLEDLSSRLATFLITTVSPGCDCKCPLEVRAVKPTVLSTNHSSPTLGFMLRAGNNNGYIAAVLAASGARPGCWSGKECDLTGHLQLQLGRSWAITLPQSNAASGSKCVLDVSEETLAHIAVGSSHPGLGAPLAAAMTAALYGTTYLAGICTCKVYDLRSRFPPHHVVPLWVVKW